MKGLIYRYHSICEPDMMDGFTQIGIDLDEIRSWESEKELTASQVLELLKPYLLSGQYSFVFSVNFFPEVSSVCEICKIPYISYIVDCPVLELYEDAVRNQCNYIFSFDEALYQEVAPMNANHIFYLPLAAASERLEKICDSITEMEKKKYESDVTFIGSLYTEKSPLNQMKGASSYLSGYLDALVEMQLKVYGCNFIEDALTDNIIHEMKKYVSLGDSGNEMIEKAIAAQFYVGNKVTEQERLRLLHAISQRFNTRLYTLSDTSTLPDIQCMGSAESMVEMPKIFHCSKINLNFTSKPIRTGIPQRIFDIMGAGGFVLTNYQAELPSYFTIGEHLECYGSEEELLQKIEYYLEHEEERKQIAINGQQLVKQYHTYGLRMALIVETVFGGE